MVKSLETDHLKVGMDRTDVIALLGEGDYRRSPSGLAYCLQPSAIDYYYFEVIFDRNEKVAKFQVVQS